MTKAKEDILIATGIIMGLLIWMFHSLLNDLIIVSLTKLSTLAGWLGWLSNPYSQKVAMILLFTVLLITIGGLSIRTIAKNAK